MHLPKSKYKTSRLVNIVLLPMVSCLALKKKYILTLLLNGFSFNNIAIQIKLKSAENNFHF